MSTRSRNRSDRSAARPPLVTYDRPGPVAKAALARRSYVDVTRRTQAPVIVLDARNGFEVLDDIAGCEPLDLSQSVGRVIALPTFEHALATSSRVTTGEW